MGFGVGKVLKYESKLVEAGYRLEYVRTSDKRPFFGVSELERKIFLYNISPEKRENVPVVSEILRYVDGHFGGFAKVL